MPTLNTPEKVLNNWVEKSEYGCWQWMGAVGLNGYGKVHINYKNLLPHRVIYELFKGKITNGLTIDHLCRNRLCVNPEHLEAVSLKENILRSNSITAKQARQTHCIRNHPLFGSNLYITPDKRRQCKICNNLRQNKFYNESRGVSCH
jgi:hypothetical protein